MSRASLLGGGLPVRLLFPSEDPVSAALMTEEELALRKFGVCFNGEEDGGASEDVPWRRRFAAGVAGVCVCGPLEKKDMRLFCLRFSLDSDGLRLDEDMAASARRDGGDARTGNSGRDAESSRDRESAGVSGHVYLTSSLHVIYPQASELEGYWPLVSSGLASIVLLGDRNTHTVIPKPPPAHFQTDKG